MGFDHEAAGQATDLDPFLASMAPEVAVLVVAVVLLGGAVYLGVRILRRLSQLNLAVNNLPARVISQPTDEQATGAATAWAPNPSFDSPLTRLTFQESLDPNRFAEASTAASKANLAGTMAALAADGVVVTIESVRLLNQGTEMIVSASASGRELLHGLRARIPVHTATGARLPVLTDPRTGKIIEQLKEMPLSTLTSKVAAVSSVVVGAAHLVASADVAKRLSQVDSKLDLLLASRRIDQIARLERIYTSARELGSREMDRPRRMEMWRLRGELRELRAAWRHEFHLKLQEIEDPAIASYLPRMFSRIRSNDRRVIGDIGEAEAQIAFIEYSMRLEHVLAIGSDTLDEFQDSLKNELEQLNQLATLLQTRAAYISGRYPDLSAQPIVEWLRAVITTYRQLLPGADANSPVPH